MVVVDISMPGRGGIDPREADFASATQPRAFLIFTMHASATYAQQAFRAGARG